MNDKTKDVMQVIRSISKKAEAAKDAGKTLHYSQAALNMAHVLATLDSIEKE